MCDCFVLLSFVVYCRLQLWLAALLARSLLKKILISMSLLPAFLETQFSFSTKKKCKTVAEANSFNGMRNSSFMFHFQVWPLDVVLVHILIQCACVPENILRQNCTQLGNIRAFCSITLVCSFSVRQLAIYKRFCMIFTKKKKIKTTKLKPRGLYYEAE